MRKDRCPLTLLVCMPAIARCSRLFPCLPFSSLRPSVRPCLPPSLSGGVLVGCSIFSCIVARAAGAKLNSLHGSLINKFGEKDITKVRQAFLELDHDNSGALDTTELALVATSLGAGEPSQLIVDSKTFIHIFSLILHDKQIGIYRAFERRAHLSL